MKYHIEFEIRVPDRVPEKQVREWVRYNLGDKGNLTNGNPLYDTSFDAVYKSIKIERVEK